MMPSPLVLVHVGDLIEFSHSSDGDHDKTAMIQGRVVDVDLATPHVCVVQVSPFEPLQRVDLSNVRYKVVYGIGEMARVTSAMIGLELEIQQSGGGPEHGVIKQVDSALNCALLAFDNGHKDWRDLTMNAFKVVGHHIHTQRSSSSPMKPAKNVDVEPQPPLQGVHATQMPIPETDVIDFDWYAEGGHVELCDRDGRFMEGALLCAQRGPSLQLYNEQRQFFEIQTHKQSFKVVIHGLVSVKSTVPLGQAVEIYSPMHGEFRRGMVLKAAEIGKLTPIRFVEVRLEWLDLTSQTFKLVFIASAKLEQTTAVQKHPGVQDKNDRVAMDNVRIPHIAAVEAIQPTGDQPPSRSQEQSQQNYHNLHQVDSISDHDLKSPTRLRTAKRHYHNDKHTHQLPILELGQTIELFDNATKQFVKYRVAHVLHPEQAHSYDIEVLLDNTTGSHGSGLLRSIAATKRTISLAAVKARLLLQPEHMKTYHPLLAGFRVDVYDKSDRSVLTGKIIEFSLRDEDDDTSTDGGRVHVKLKDGTKRWFDVKTTKIKVKLQGERPTPSQLQSNDTTVEEPLLSEHGMWQRAEHERPKTPRVAMVEDFKLSQLSRQQSEQIVCGNTLSPRNTRQASSPDIGRVQASLEVSSSSSSTIPSLDFSGIKRSHAEPVIPPETMPADVHSESRRSSGSNADALTDLLPPMDDVWTEESTGDAAPMRYVHTATGQVQFDRPQWLKQTDATTGGTLILNTLTGVHFQLPGGSTSLTASPATSGRAVVTLPVGPLEAARVVNQLNTATVDLCGVAFGT